MELIFEVREAEEGGFTARALGHPIFTEAETWDELRGNVLEASALHFEDSTVRPRIIQLHYVKDELIPVEAARSFPVESRRIASFEPWSTLVTQSSGKKEATSGSITQGRLRTQSQFPCTAH